MSNHSATQAAELRINFREFLFLVAAMMSCQALAVDAMLPALPTIAHELGVTNANHVQWVITSYIAGLGVGQLFWGVVSDSYGRRSVLLIGLMLYVVAALLSGFSSGFESLLMWRFIHGVAASSMVVARSMIRDLYEGRQMARVMSLSFIVFMLVPMLAPSIGQLILAVGSWRMMFSLFGAFAAVIWVWLMLRLPETLHPEHRMTLSVDHIMGATRRVLTDRASLWYTVAVALLFGSIMGYVSMVQQVFGEVFHRPAIMPGMFALCAAAMAMGSVGNAKVVGRYGMRIVSQCGLLLFIGAALLHLIVAAVGFEQLWSFVLLQALTLSAVGFMLANFGAMAMENMGEMAGIAAAIQGFIGTVGGALFGALSGGLFNGSTVPLVASTLVSGVATFVCVFLAERGRLFQPHHPSAEQAMMQAGH